MPRPRSETLPYRPRYPMPPTSIRLPDIKTAPEVKTLDGCGRPDDDVPSHRPVLRLDARHICRSIRQMTAEMLMMAGDRVQMRRDRRRTTCHVRQISMYICHVGLRLSLTDIGTAFGRDRTTVSHACNVVEDRRDDPGFDDFVSAIERIAISVYGAGGGCDHG